MGEKWRVTVERWDEDDATDLAVWTEVSTLVAERGQLARFAPGVVADALGVNTHASTILADVVTAAFATETPDASAEPTPTDGASKRKRRTKAEMEADRAREQAEAANGATVTDLAQAARQATAGTDAILAAAHDASQASRDATEAVAETQIGQPVVPFNPFAPK